MTRSATEVPHLSPGIAKRPPADFVIVTGDLVRTGGMDRANLALASYLARQGHVVHAVAHRVDEELRRQPNVIFHRVAKPANSYLIGSPLLDRAGRRLGRKLASTGARVVVNGGNCAFGDINWVHYVHAAYRPQHAGSAARRLKNAWSHRASLAGEAKCLKMARVVIANSDRTRRDLIERVGVREERVRTVYYGIDAAAFAPATDEERADARRQLGWPADRPVVIFTGGLGDRRKGFDTLFAAWVELCRGESWDADLCVIGSGAELPAWERRAMEANISSRIRFLGFRNDVPWLLRAADALVAPTRYEAYGLGVQEALACGLPAIVSDQAGVAERYPAELSDLLLLDFEDVAGLVDRLRRWRSEMAGVRTRVAVLSELIRSRSWDEMAGEIVRFSECSS